MGKWVPEIGEKYFTICLKRVVNCYWKDDGADAIYMRLGMVFKTEEEARSVLEQERWDNGKRN